MILPKPPPRPLSSFAERGALRQPRSLHRLLSRLLPLSAKSERGPGGEALLLLLAFAAGCQPQYGPRKTSLRLRGSEPADAMVIVDDQPIAPLGVVAKRGMAVLRGRHRITVQRAGYFPWDRVVEADDDMIYLDVSLQKLPD